METRDKRITAQHLAGFFDGEGMIQLTVGQPGQREYKVRLNLFNTSKAKLEAIQADWGGNLRTLKQVPGHKIVYRLEWWSSKAIPMLHTLLSDPGFMIKRRQAECALEFWDTKPCHNYVGSCGKQGYPEETTERLLRLHAEVKHLNQRGVLAVAETKPESHVVPPLGSDSPSPLES